MSQQETILKQVDVYGQLDDVNKDIEYVRKYGGACFIREVTQKQ